MVGFDEWMMVLTIKDESVGRASNLVFLGSLRFWLVRSRKDGIMSKEIA